MNDPWLLPLWVALGAIPGALSRHYLILLMTQKYGSNFPLGTLVVNLSGSIMMGFCATILDKNIPWMDSLIIMGGIASYTTFSTYALDTSQLFRRKHYVRGWLYFIGTPVAGFLGVELGIWIAEGGFLPPG